MLQVNVRTNSSPMFSLLAANSKSELQNFLQRTACHEDWSPTWQEVFENKMFSKKIKTLVEFKPHSNSTCNPHTLDLLFHKTKTPTLSHLLQIGFIINWCTPVRVRCMSVWFFSWLCLEVAPLFSKSLELNRQIFLLYLTAIRLCWPIFLRPNLAPLSPTV